MGKKKQIGILDWRQVDQFRINLPDPAVCGTSTWGHVALLTERVGGNDLSGAVVFRESISGFPLKWIAGGTWKDGEEFYRDLKSLFVDEPPARLAEIIRVRMLVFEMLLCTAGNHNWDWMAEIQSRIRELRLFSRAALRELLEEQEQRRRNDRRTTGYQVLGIPEPAWTR